MSKPALVVVEDDAGIQSQLRWAFDGFDVQVAGDRDSALARVRALRPSVVTLDLGLPPDPGGVSEGFAVLDAIVSEFPATKVIVISGHDDRATAVAAIGRGAHDFFEKPIDPDLLQIMVARAHHVFELEAENRRLLNQSETAALEGIVATSPEMLRVCQTVEKLAPTEVTTLLLGESGTGKELLVRALHRLSPRARGPFVAINCAAIPETLLESELFGYERGAFTGAAKQTVGKIEMADGGTLFLDEVGDLPSPLQAKLLRFLQERVIERVGGRKEIPVDVRVVCATHQDLPTMIESGGFREDLYYRISEITVRVPALRERSGDAVVLARVFVKRFAEQFARPIKGLAADAVRAIEDYSWPGNVRELENRSKRAVIMSDATLISAGDLELAGEEIAAEALLDLRTARDQAESRAIQRAFAFTNGNVSLAAQMLGVTRPTLYTLMRKHDIKAN
ncbi:MAG: PEP-CTERM-box response regulator transcription factor [Chromatiales bacterium]|nr:PEP-CTERM-box response regulator transcription factor [Chromatiales bacterium]